MKRIWNKWKLLAEKIGKFQFQVVFSILYFLILTPIGLIVGQSKDYLRSKKFYSWERTNDNTSTLERMRKQ